MTESKKNKQSFDTSLIQKLHERHGVTKHYIRMSINGDRVGVIPIRISEEYKKLLRAKKIAEKQALENLDK